MTQVSDPGPKDSFIFLLVFGSYKNQQRVMCTTNDKHSYLLATDVRAYHIAMKVQYPRVVQDFSTDTGVVQDSHSD